MKQTYFIVRYDGVHGPFAEDELLAKITPNEYGDTDFGRELRFHDKLLDRDDFRHEDIVVLRGSVVVPKPKTVVQTFEFPNGDR